MITIEEDDEVFITKPTRELIYESIPKGKTTISSKVATAFKIGRRKALEHLTNLEEVGLLKSEMGVLRYKSGARAKARIFKRI
jgi:predicted ArsR family transcriptional regulator